MFRVESKDTRMTSMTLFWCLYCYLSTDLAHSSSVSVSGFDRVNDGSVDELQNGIYFEPDH